MGTLFGLFSEYNEVAVDTYLPYVPDSTSQNLGILWIAVKIFEPFSFDEWLSVFFCFGKNFLAQIRQQATYWATKKKLMDLESNNHNNLEHTSDLLNKQCQSLDLVVSFLEQKINPTPRQLHHIKQYHTDLQLKKILMTPERRTTKTCGKSFLWYSTLYSQTECFWRTTKKSCFGFLRSSLIPIYIIEQIEPCLELVLWSRSCSACWIRGFQGVKTASVIIRIISTKYGYHSIFLYLESQQSWKWKVHGE